MGLIVYGANLSPFVRKVRVALAEKGIEYKLDPVTPFAPPPEFLAISPLKRIPVLRDTDLPEPNTLPDSSAICDYLEHKYPKPALYPADPFQRARAIFYEEYADTQIAQNIVRGVFFERIVKKFIKQKTDEDVVAKTMQEAVPPIFDWLEKEIGTKKFFAGDAFSIADIAMGTMFVNFEHAGEKVDAARWPNLARYIAMIHARPSFKAMIDEERPLCDQLRAA